MGPTSNDGCPYKNRDMQQGRSPCEDTGERAGMCPQAKDCQRPQKPGGRGGTDDHSELQKEPVLPTLDLGLLQKHEILSIYCFKPPVTALCSGSQRSSHTGAPLRSAGLGCTAILLALGPSWGAASVQRRTGSWGGQEGARGHTLRSPSASWQTSTAISALSGGRKHQSPCAPGTGHTKTEAEATAL